MAFPIHRYIKLTSSLGKIALAKPSKWGIATLKAVTSKINLPEDEFIKHVIYCSQWSDNKINKYSFDSIGELDSEEFNSLFLNFINSDEALLQESNASRLATTYGEALKILKSHIENTTANLGLHMLDMMLHVSIQGSWLGALEGDAKARSTNLSDLSSSFRKMAEDYPIYSKNLKELSYLKDFDAYRADFIFLCDRLNMLVEKVRSFEMWLPSRYSTMAIKELIAIDPSKLDRKQIEFIIFKSVDADIDEEIFPSWKNSVLFKAREQIIEEAFSAHKSKLFAPSITCFLTQLDHVVLEIARLLKIDKKKRNANHMMLKDICTFIEKIIMWNTPITRFFESSDFGQQIYLFQLISLAKYLRDVVFEDTSKMQDRKDKINRHGVLHGVFSNYPNSTNSTKLILLIDDLNNFFQNLPKFVELDEK